MMVRNIHVPGFYVFYIYMLIVCGWNSYLFLLIAAHAKVHKERARAEASFFCGCFIFLAAVTATPAAIVLWDMFRKRAMEERSRFFALWSGMFCSLNARLYIKSLGTLIDPNGHEFNSQFFFAWPMADRCWDFAFMYAVACVVQHLYVPTELPKNWKACFGLVVFAVTMAVTLWFTSWSTGHSGAQPRWRDKPTIGSGNRNLGFLPDQGHRYLPLLSLMLTELLRLLRTGDGHGASISASLLIATALCFNSPISWQKVVVNPEKDGSGLCLCFTLLVGFAACAVASMDRPVSTDPRLVSLTEGPDGDQVDVDRLNPPDAGTISIGTHDSHSRGWRRRCLRALGQAKQYSQTFIGQTLLCLANGLYTFVTYSQARDALVAELVPRYDGKTKVYGNSFVDAVIQLSGISIALSLISLLGDSNRLVSNWSSRRCFASSFLSSLLRIMSVPLSVVLRLLPVDRHFRLTTLIKAGMIGNKVAVLFFNGKPWFDAMSVLLLALQLVAVLGTILLLTGLDAFNMIKAKVEWLQVWRHGHLLRWSYVACVLCFQVLAVEVSIGTALGSAGNFAQVLSTARAWIVVGVALPYALPFLAFFNEIRLSLACFAETSGPHFYKVQSKQGVCTMAAVCAVTLPLEALISWIFTGVLYWGYIVDLTTGHVLEGSGYVGGWVPPVTCHATVGLCISVACSWWAASEMGPCRQ